MQSSRVCQAGYALQVIGVCGMEYLEMLETSPQTNPSNISQILPMVSSMYIYIAFLFSPDLNGTFLVCILDGQPVQTMAMAPLIVVTFQHPPPLPEHTLVASLARKVSQPLVVVQSQKTRPSLSHSALIQNPWAWQPV